MSIFRNRYIAILIFIPLLKSFTAAQSSRCNIAWERQRGSIQYARNTVSSFILLCILVRDFEKKIAVATEIYDKFAPRGLHTYNLLPRHCIGANNDWLEVCIQKIDYIWVLLYQHALNHRQGKQPHTHTHTHTTHTHSDTHTHTHQRQI